MRSVFWAASVCRFVNLIDIVVLVSLQTGVETGLVGSVLGVEV